MRSAVLEGVDESERETDADAAEDGVCVPTKREGEADGNEELDEVADGEAPKLSVAVGEVVAACEAVAVDELVEVADGVAPLDSVAVTGGVRVGVVVADCGVLDDDGAIDTVLVVDALEPRLSVAVGAGVPDGV